MYPETVEESLHVEVFASVDVRMAAVEALGELMRETPIDRLSVNRICERAEISRSIF